MTNAYAAYGTLIKIGDGGTPESFTTIAEVNSIGGPSLALETADATHHGSPGAWKEYVATLLDGGEISLDLNFLPADATQDYSDGLLSDMVSRTLRNFKLVFPDTGATTWTLPAFVTAYEPSAPVDDKLSASITLKISGQPTLA